MIERGAAGGYQAYQIEKSRSVFEAKIRSLRRAIAAGVNVAYGTDAGVQVLERPLFVMKDGRVHRRP